MSPDKPRPGAPNRAGLTIEAYKGRPSTLCNGCGHDAISNQLVRAFYEYGIDPAEVVKFSGIGCSSKTPAYFLGRSFGFNAIHGRMPSVATGALVANRRLKGLAVSGDGDTASIGIGQFVHAMRRNIPLVYILENNGVYGLTKGQFSATADRGSRRKGGEANELPPVDCCALAIELGCGYVARSFAGDPKQLSALLKGALGHRGTAFIDVLSPCVTFNNHEGSTKSYPYLKGAEEWLHDVGFIPYFEQIAVDYADGTTREIALHDGSRLTLRKLEREYDPTDRAGALAKLRASSEEGTFLTGLFYIDGRKPDITELLDLDDEPLAALPPEKLRPSRAAFEEILARLR
ncbi:MAG: 2-oxoacid:ferredoxin oxidoreductase subunit beta [Acidobacteria bacterium]|nr:2-oxoacid:ferredoxin oxidoreductase subunit beta [Acidobacteriota bacterium]